MAEYFLHSGVRKRHNRTKRMLAPTAALVQHIGGLIVRRNRPVRIGEDKLKDILPQLIKAEAEGRLELRTPDGRIIDLATMQAGPAPGVPPLPNPPLDSAAKDKPAGIPMPAHYEGTGIGVATKVPEVIADKMDEAEEDESDEEETPDEEAAVETPKAPLTSPATGEIIGPNNPDVPNLVKKRKGK